MLPLLELGPFLRDVTPGLHDETSVTKVAKITLFLFDFYRQLIGSGRDEIAGVIAALQVVIDRHRAVFNQSADQSFTLLYSGGPLVGAWAVQFLIHVLKTTNSSVDATFQLFANVVNAAGVTSGKYVKKVILSELEQLTDKFMAGRGDHDTLTVSLYGIVNLIHLLRWTVAQQRKLDSLRRRLWFAAISINSLSPMAPEILLQALHAVVNDACRLVAEVEQVKQMIYEACRIEDTELTKAVALSILRLAEKGHYIYDTKLRSVAVVRAQQVAHYLADPTTDKLKGLSDPMGDEAIDSIIARLLTPKKWLEPPTISDDEAATVVLLTVNRNYPCQVSGDLNEGHCGRCGYHHGKNPYAVILKTRPFLEDAYELKGEVIDLMSIPQHYEVALVALLDVWWLILALYRVLDTSQVIPYLVKLLRHDNREVRLFAARVIPLTVIAPALPELDQRINDLVAEATTMLSEGPMLLGEAAITLLSWLTTALDPEESPQPLAALVAQFSHTNEQFANHAFVGVVLLGVLRGIHPPKLVMPIIGRVVDPIITRPLALTRFYELGMNPQQLLERLRDYAVPKYLDDYSHDYLGDIAARLRLSKGEIVVKVLPRIIAAYVTKRDFNPQLFHMALTNASTRFEAQNITSLLREQAKEAYWQILILLNDDNHEEIRLGLDRIADATGNDLQTELGSSALLLVSKFKDTVHNLKVGNLADGKVAALRAAEFLLSEIPEQLLVAIGQVLTCLQTCLDMGPRIQHFALRCWHVLVMKLPPAKLVSLMDILVLCLLQVYPKLEREDLRQLVRLILGHVLAADVDPQFAQYLWLLPFIEGLEQVVPRLDPKLAHFSRSQMMLAFIRRLATGNTYVVDQALKDLRYYFDRYHQELHRDMAEPALAQLVANLAHEILAALALRPEPAARALAALGLLDPLRFAVKRLPPTPFVILWDWRNDEENANFIRDFVETVLVKLFWALPDPNRQLFYAYAMQELYKVAPTTKGYSDVARATLLPFMNSVYVGPAIKKREEEYPLFPRRYDPWVCTFASDLMLRLVGRTKGAPKRLLQTLTVLLRDRNDVTVLRYLLKYVVVAHVINNSAEVVDDIRTEFGAVLTLTGTGEDDRQACLEMLAVVDYCLQWILAATPVAKTGTDEGALRVRRQLRHLQTFVELILPSIIADRALACDMYERTILTVETMVTLGAAPAVEKAPILQQMYARIGDYDSVTGVLHKFSLENISAHLRQFQYTRQWAVAQALMAVTGQVDDEMSALCDRGLYQEVLLAVANSAYKTANGTPLAALARAAVAAGLLHGDPPATQRWLAAWDATSVDEDVMVEIARKLTRGDYDFTPIYPVVGRHLVPLTSANYNANRQLWRYLHCMYDVAGILLGSLTAKQLEARLSTAASDDQWHILQFRRLGYRLARDLSGEAHAVLQLAQWARRHQRFDLAGRLVVEAMALDEPKSQLEYAKLLWDQGKQPEAILSLDKYKQLSLDPEVQLQYAQWLDELAHVLSDEIIRQYTAALVPGQGKPHFALATYFGKLLQSQAHTTGLYEVHILRHLMKLLAFAGSEFAFEAVPKLLTTWLDYAQTVVDKPSLERKLKLDVIVKELTKLVPKISTSLWFVGITQILLRFLHPHTPSYELLETLLVNIALKYPSHALWYILSHIWLKDELRQQRISAVLQRLSKDHKRQITQAQRLVGRLIDIALFKPPKAWRNQRHQFSLAQDLHVNMEGSKFNLLVVPVRQHLAISARPVYLTSVMDACRIFWSLQAPRQISVKGSDGKQYKLMVKQDDTRKDAKVVEFTTAVNRTLDAEHAIVNYAVIPLSSAIGVLEFVEDVTTFKQALATQRMRLGQSFLEGRLASKLTKAQRLGSQEEMVKVFSEIVSANPPVLHRWFVDEFADPASWYAARTQFTRLLAVMLMVGYYVGLGDRHCENILLFVKLGQVLHIDFECLFDKGETLPVPEIVPFRLTPNFVDGMGICGYEGKFRATCERVGTLVRQHEAVLMNVLETLLHDPLLDWKTDELVTPQGQLTKVRRKIRGLMLAKEELPVNIEGQVDKLIQEAVSPERLARMYPGWGPYL